MNVRPDSIVILCVFIAFAVIEAFNHGFINKRGERASDKPVEIITLLVLSIGIQPFILFFSAWLASLAFPEYRDALADINLALAFLLLLVVDDLTQYWWHRTCHRVNWLYKLHRPHHDAHYISIRLVYRNNLFYYLFFPSLWLSGILIYLGLGWIYAVYFVLKMLVIIGAHSDVPWDEPLYKIKWLSPVMWLVERTISTPSTHSMHHGRYSDDPNTNYKGNYGNFLFFWDVLFGTAVITRKRPNAYGIEHLPESDIAEQILWPLVKSTPSITASMNTHYSNTKSA